MLSQQEVVAEQVKYGIEKLLSGQMDRKEFEAFVKQSNERLDEIKERQAWEGLNWRTMY